MKTEVVSYKGLKFNISSHKHTLELVVDNNIFSDMENFILNLSLMMEYATVRKPKYVIINRLNSDFEIPSELFRFTSENIFSPLFKGGVLKIIMLINTHIHQQYYLNADFDIPDLISFTTEEEVQNWLTTVQD